MPIGRIVARIPHLASALAAALIAFAGAAWPVPASAAITVELSPEAADAFKEAGETPRAITRRLQSEFNLGLEELGKTNPDAKALFDSNQKLRIVCLGTKEAEDAGLTPDTGVYGGGGKTKGDFDANGRPRTGGTAIIAIECGQLRERGLARPVVEADPNSTVYKILVHELLHAANRERQHPPDKLEIYEKFVQDFEAALARARARPPAKQVTKQKESTAKKQTRSKSGTEQPKEIGRRQTGPEADALIQFGLGVGTGLMMRRQRDGRDYHKEK